MGLFGFGNDKRKEYDQLVVTELNNIFGITPNKGGVIKMQECLDYNFKHGAYISIISIAFGYAGGIYKSNAAEAKDILEKIANCASAWKNNGLLDPAAADRVAGIVNKKYTEFFGATYQP